MGISGLEFARMCDATLTGATATHQEMVDMVEIAKKYHFYSVIGQRCYLDEMVEGLKGTDVLVGAGCSNITGADPAEVKANFAKWHLSHGAQEIENIMNISAFKSGLDKMVVHDVRAVRDAIGPDIVYKCILEVCYLDDDEIRHACDLLIEGGVDYEEDPRVLYSPSIYVKYMPVNVNNPDTPILSDVNFRKALFLAVDRESIAKLLNAKPANYLLSTRFIADVTTGESYRNSKQGSAIPDDYCGYDPEQAVKLFEQALTDAGQDKVVLTLTYRNDDADMTAIAETLQSSWPSIFGADRFELILNGLPTSQSNEQIRAAKTDATSFDLGFAGWSTNELAPWNGLKVYGSAWANRYDTFTSERYDELWTLANSSEERFDHEKRLDYVAEMESIWLDNVSGIPVIELIDKTLKADRVQLAADQWVNRVGFGWIYASVTDAD